VKPEHMKLMGIDDTMVVTKINWEHESKDGEDHDLTYWEVRDRSGVLLFRLTYITSVLLDRPHTKTFLYIKTDALTGTVQTARLN
jgi:hypothetical protein